MAADPTPSLRLAFWNTWLLAPRLWPGGPRVPGWKQLGLPADVTERCALVAQAAAGRFDVTAMSEVFDPEEQEAVAAAWPSAEAVIGPTRRRLKMTGSGLMTMVDPSRARVIASARHAYLAGGDFRDSDTLSTKGALLVRVEAVIAGAASAPAVDVFSTHLIAGGEFLPIPGHDDHARHHRARMAQLDELLAFIGREHDPALPLLVMGDLNVAADDPDPILADPRVRYDELADRLGSIGLRDVWADHGIGPGHTCTFTDAVELPADRDDPDQVADIARADPETQPGERIDYLWLHVPEGIEVTVGRPRRWAFPGRPARGGPAGSLSDHLALSVTLHFSE